MKDYLQSIYSGNKNTKEKNYQMALIVSLIIGVQGVFMFFVSIFSSSMLQTITSISYGVLMLIVYVYTKISKKLKVFYVTAILMALLLEVNFMYNGGTEGFGVIWITVIPLFTVYLFGFKTYIAVNSIYMIILIIGFWTPAHNLIYDFIPSFRLRFPLVYAFHYIFGLLLRLRILKTENTLEDQSKYLSKEINQAAEIQRAYFRQPAKTYKGWKTAQKNIPMAGVSGDFYDLFTSDDKLDGVGIFDISGHGISSGLITMLVKTIIQADFYAKRKTSLADTVHKINEDIITAKGNIENYLTGVIIKIKDDNSIEYVNAGHQLPIIYRKKENKLDFLEKSPLSMGAIAMTNFPSVYESLYTTMESGDEIILYTDGLTEVKNEEGKVFGRENLMNLIKENLALSVEDQVTNVLNSVQDYCKDPSSRDDMTILILQKE